MPYSQSASTDFQRVFPEVEPVEKREFNPTVAKILSPEGNTTRWFYGQRSVFYVIQFIQPPEDRGGFAEDSATSANLSPAVSVYPEPDRSLWRGVFSPPYRRKFLFSQEHVIRTADLPRWKPHITIDIRRLTRTDDD